MNVYQLRPAHIQNLGMCFPQMQIKKINEFFSVPFSCKGGLNFLTVFLPTEFPNVPPIFKVEKPMTHSMIANDNRTVTSNAFRFNPMTPSLGTTVKEIISKLTYGSICTSPMGSMNPSPNTSGYISQPGSMLSQPQPPMPRTLPPQDMMEVDGLSEEQIKKILGDRNEMDKFIESLSSIVSLKRDIEKTAEQLETAKANFDKENFDDPQPEDISVLRREVGEKDAKAIELRGKNNDINRNKKILRTRMTELNKRTETVFDDFMVESDVTVDEFATAYLADRVSYHRADIKFKNLGKK